MLEFLFLYVTTHQMNYSVWLWVWFLGYGLFTVACSCRNSLTSCNRRTKIWLFMRIPTYVLIVLTQATYTVV